MTLNDIMQPPRDSVGAKACQSSDGAGAKASKLSDAIETKTSAVMNTSKSNQNDQHKVL